jgi:hypothetical protein
VAKKLTQREQARKQRDDELEKLAARAKDLHRKAAKSEKSAFALGEILVEVRDYNPHGGLTLWIQENIGKDKSTLNRCKYAISLADPKSERNNKKKKAAKRVHRENLEIIRAAASTLLTSADKGDIGRRNCCPRQDHHYRRRCDEADGTGLADEADGTGLA